VEQDIESGVVKVGAAAAQARGRSHHFQGEARQRHARIITDRYGRIVETCGSAASLLNVSARALWGRQLPLFVADRRPEIQAQLDVAARGHEVVLDTVLRPRDRKPMYVTIRLRPYGHDVPAEVEWTIDTV
jgi:hypothetical protein